MKFTSEDLMKAMGLQVGDKIKVFKDNTDTYKAGVYQLEVCVPNWYVLVHIEDEDYRFKLKWLVDLEYEILPKPKRVGELKCGGDYCNKCPLNFVCKNTKKRVVGETLYEILEYFYIDDQEIYDLLKARLDKEVE